MKAQCPVSFLLKNTKQKRNIFVHLSDNLHSTVFCVFLEMKWQLTKKEWRMNIKILQCLTNQPNCPSFFCAQTQQKCICFAAIDHGHLVPCNRTKSLCPWPPAVLVPRMSCCTFVVVNAAHCLFSCWGGTNSVLAFGVYWRKKRLLIKDASQLI